MRTRWCQQSGANRQAWEVCLPRLGSPWWRGVQDAGKGGRALPHVISPENQPGVQPGPGDEVPKVTGSERYPHCREGSGLPKDDVEAEMFEEETQSPASQARAEDSSGLPGAGPLLPWSSALPGHRASHRHVAGSSAPAHKYGLPWHRRATKNSSPAPCLVAPSPPGPGFVHSKLLPVLQEHVGFNQAAPLAFTIVPQPSASHHFQHPGAPSSPL